MAVPTSLNGGQWTRVKRGDLKFRGQPILPRVQHTPLQTYRQMFYNPSGFQSARWSNHQHDILARTKLRANPPRHLWTQCKFISCWTTNAVLKPSKNSAKTCATAYGSAMANGLINWAAKFFLSMHYFKSSCRSTIAPTSNHQVVT